MDIIFHTANLNSLRLSCRANHRRVFSVIIVSKFGGSVTASAEGILKAMGIIRSDLSRRYVIVSAPGSTFSIRQKS